MQSDILNFTYKIIMSLSVVAAFCEATHQTVVNEQHTTGTTFSSLEINGEEFTVGLATLMMIVDGIIYAVLGWYFRNIFPGPNQHGRSWYFVFTWSFWCGRENVDHLKPKSCKKPAAIHRDHCEADPDLPIGISLHELSKTYPGAKDAAVRDFSFNFFQGQVTAFLGHNGAGKTSTIHMLTGVMAPSSGAAFVNGRDIRTSMVDIRQSMGFTGQYDVLFQYMTVLEHLEFYISLKSDYSKERAKTEVLKMLSLTGLKASKHQLAKHLSGGQRRRLSVGIAFIGGSKVVILDEPTSGVDPSARRNIWDIIVQHRSSRTILISTHHLDEAELIGDRILMVHKGSLLCSGTPMFLKSYFGNGYHLTIAKRLASAPERRRKSFVEPILTKAHAGNAETGKILSFIKQFIGSAILSQEMGSEMTVVLPVCSGETSIFKQLFENLERNKKKLGILSYGISQTTLEQIFLEVTEAADKGMPLNRSGATAKSFYAASEDGTYRTIINADDTISYTTSSDSYGSTNELITKKKSPSQLTLSSDSTMVQSRFRGKRSVEGWTLKYQQWQAMTYKRLLHNSRNFSSYLTQIILPWLFFLISMLIGFINSPAAENMPALDIQTSLHGPNRTYFFRNDVNNTFADEMINTMVYSGFGTACMNDSKYNYKCPYNATKQFTILPLSDRERELYEEAPPCECLDNYYTCPEGSEGLPPPRIESALGVFLENLTYSKYDTEDYYLRNFNWFVEEQFDQRRPFQLDLGWSFHERYQQPLVKIWFNNLRWHNVPLGYNTFSNMVLRATLAESGEDPDDYGISLTNFALPAAENKISSWLIMKIMSESGLVMITMVGICFVPPSFTTFLINERINKEKRIQYISGVSSTMYWCTAFLWDMFNYMITVTGITLTAYCFGSNIYSSRENIYAFVVLLTLFGWSTIPLMYLLLRQFKDASISYMALFLFNLSIGLNTTSSVFFLSLPFFANTSIVVIKSLFSKMFMIFPQYCLGDGLLKMANNQFTYDIFSTFGADFYVSPFDSSQLRWHFFIMAFEGIFFFALLLIIEARFFVFTHTSGRENIVDYKEDSDVGLERQRVITSGADNEALVLRNLSKTFRRGLQKFVAVDNLCLGIPRGECFGLLGINGAGKTTTFKMITGDTTPSGGMALLDGKCISDDESNMGMNLGYCPQYDALDHMLTAKETLEFYAALKGIQASDVAQVCHSAITKFGLQDHVHKRTGQLSAGNRRKLSAALAVLGDPAVVLMDEPTTGMDPGTRRHVWDNVIQIIKDNRSVIVTSHSMAECDVLCTRLAIMVNGQFMCLGTGQHLKNKFGRGYTVNIRAAGNPPNINRISNMMSEALPGAILTDQHMCNMEFEVPKTCASLSKIFGTLDPQKQNGFIEDYAVTQTSLDQVFLHFARYQNDSRVDGVVGGAAPDYIPHDTDGYRHGGSYYDDNMDTQSVASMKSVGSSIFSVFSGHGKIRRRRQNMERSDANRRIQTRDKIGQFDYSDWSYYIPDDVIHEMRSHKPEQSRAKSEANTQHPLERHGKQMPPLMLADYLGQSSTRSTHRYLKNQQSTNRHQEKSEDATRKQSSSSLHLIPEVLRSKKSVLKD